MIFSAANTTLGISTTEVTSDLDQSGYDALSYTNVGQLETIGGFGGSAEEVTFSALDKEFIERVKGVRDSGTLEITVGRDAMDAGQLAVIAAEATRARFAFEMIFDDEPTGGTPSKRYFTAAVGSLQETPDSANNVVRMTITLWLHGPILRINAAAA